MRDLVEIETAKTALRFFLDRKEGETSTQIAGLASIICSVARHWCNVEDHHLEALDRIRSRLTVRRKGLTAKNRARLRQFADRRNLEALLSLPMVVHDRLRRKTEISPADARDMQIALALELSLMMPIRRANLVGLSLERHIIRGRGERIDSVYVVIPGSEVKNGEDLEYPLPTETVSLLDFYLRRCRRVLAEAPGEWLFPGDRPDRHKSADHFSRQFTKSIRRLIGVDVNLHLMRHLGAKLYLDRNPGAYELVRRVLAHKRLSTALDHYVGLEMEAAVQHFDAVILGIRSALAGGASDD